MEEWLKVKPPMDHHVRCRRSSPTTFRKETQRAICQSAFSTNRLSYWRREDQITRLIDRIFASGVKPLAYRDLASTDPGYARLRNSLKERDGTSEEEMDEAVTAFLSSLPVVVEDPFEIELLDGVPVIVADDVARFCYTSMEAGRQMSDAVATMAPPFDRFWIEFQGVSNRFDNAYSWGVLVTSHEGIPAAPKDSEAPRWVLELTMFAEKRKGKPAGPVIYFRLGLGDDGTWFRHDDGSHYWVSRLPTYQPQIPSEVEENLSDFMNDLLFPALMTISFMHAKNVTVEPVDPPEKLSRKFEKRTGRPLVRYHVLDIDPMRRQLEATGASRGNLRKSLHLARGHFKVFTEDAPLFGRHVGTYWWEPHVRGQTKEGIVIKDYRVVAPGGLGREYVEASVEPGAAPGPSVTDPDVAGRGRAAHNRTQNLTARTVAALGFVPRTPYRDEPLYDLAWENAETTWVCEVKSLTDKNEERQMQRAVGQVIQYRQKLTALGRDVQAVIVTEKQPNDMNWDVLCGLEAIVLAWPEVLEERLAAIEETMRSTDADE